MHGKNDESNVLREVSKSGSDFSSTQMDRSGKILIDLSLTSKMVQNQDIANVIREIFELNNSYVQVEKVVMSVGASMWHIQKSNLSECSDGEDDVKGTSERQSKAGVCKAKDESRVSLTMKEECRERSVMMGQCLAPDIVLMLNMKRKQLLRNKIKFFKKKYKMSRTVRKSGQNLTKSRQREMVKLHSSPGITNLLSQIYPNPYQMINLVEPRNKSNHEDTSNITISSYNFNVRYKAGCNLIIEDGKIEENLGNDCFSTMSDLKATSADSGLNKATDSMKKIERSTHGIGEKSLKADSIETLRFMGQDDGLEKDNDENDEENDVNDGPVKYGQRRFEEVESKSLTNRAKSKKELGYMFGSGTRLSINSTIDNKCLKNKGVIISDEQSCAFAVEDNTQNEFADMEKKKSKKPATRKLTESEGNVVKKKLAISKVNPSNKWHPKVKEKTLVNRGPIFDQNVYNKKRVNQKVCNNQHWNSQNRYGRHSKCFDSKFDLIKQSAKEKSKSYVKKKSEIQYLIVMENMIETENRDMHDKSDHAPTTAFEKVEKPEEKTKLQSKQTGKKAESITSTWRRCKNLREMQKIEVGNRTCDDKERKMKSSATLPRHGRKDNPSDNQKDTVDNWRHPTDGGDNRKKTPTCPAANVTSEDFDNLRIKEMSVKNVAIDVDFPIRSHFLSDSDFSPRTSTLSKSFRGRELATVNVRKTIDLQQENLLLHDKQKPVDDSENVEKVIRARETEVRETTRSFEYVDSSTNRLRQQQDAGCISKDPFRKLEKVVRNGEWECNLFDNRDLRLYEKRNQNCRRSDMLPRQSHHSMHTLSVDNSMGRLRISADNLTCPNSDLLTGRGADRLLWRSKLFDSSPLGNTLKKGGISCVTEKMRRKESFEIGNLLKKRTESKRLTVRRGSRRMNNSDSYVSINRNSALQESEVPEFLISPSPFVIYVESNNELGSFFENTSDVCEGGRSGDSFRNRKKRNTSSICLADVKMALDEEETLLHGVKMEIKKHENHLREGILMEMGLGFKANSMSLLSVNVVALDDDVSSMKPAVAQEITWYLHSPTVVTVALVQYRNEHHYALTLGVSSVLYAAVIIYFLSTNLMHLPKVLHQELKGHCSRIISPHEWRSFLNGDNGDEQMDRNLVESDEEPVIEIIKRANFGTFPNSSGIIDIQCPNNWNVVHTESSAYLQKAQKLLKRTIELSGKLHGRSRNLNLCDPHELKSADDNTEHGKPLNLYALGSSSVQVPPKEERTGNSLNAWDCRNTVFDDVAPLVLRYMSTESANISLEDKSVPVLGSSLMKTADSLWKPTVKSSNRSDNSYEEGEGNLENVNRRKISCTTYKKSETEWPNDVSKVRECEKEEDNDSDSTSSFCNSKDHSGMGETVRLDHPKKSNGKSHFAERLLRELRHLRESVVKKREPRQKMVRGHKKVADELEDVLSEFEAIINGEVEEIEKEDNANVIRASNQIAIPTNHSIPRKIFRASFRGKKSLTELMIDLKDVSISEMSDISVEKKKFSTDHTKVSIVISKQQRGSDASRMCAAILGSGKKSEPQKEKSEASIGGESLALSRQKHEEVTMSEDDAMHEGVDSGGSKLEKIEKCVGTWGSGGKSKTYGRHKFDFYNKMSNGSPTFDSLRMNEKRFVFHATSSYEKELEPLKEALTDLQIRMRDLGKGSFGGREDYYERAKMSAGYCHSCKSKTILPDDSPGYYKRFHRLTTKQPNNGCFKYYFTGRSSTKSSFHPISSSSDITHNYCRLRSTPLTY